MRQANAGSRHTATTARLVLLAFLAGALIGAPAPALARPADGSTLYLPLVLINPCPPRGQVIWGCIENNGQRLSGVSVELTYVHYLVGVTQRWTTTSDADGYFAFENIPTAQSTDYLEALFSNDTDPTRLSSRRQPFNYTAGSQFSLGNWELSNIPLVDPADGQHITLPHTFTWGPRPFHLGDNYVFVLIGPGGSSAYFQQFAGNQSTFSLTFLPIGFQLGQTNRWLVRIEPNFPGLSPESESFQQFQITIDAASQPPRPNPASRLAEP